MGLTGQSKADAVERALRGEAARASVAIELPSLLRVPVVCVLAASGLRVTG